MHLIHRDYHAGGESSGFDALIIGGDRHPGGDKGWGEDEGGGEDAAAALEMCGGRVVGSGTLSDAPARLATLATRPLILLDLRQVEDEAISAGLSRLDGMAAGRDLAMVAAITPAQIDVVAAGLVLSRHQILCDPQPADWIAAMAGAQGADRLVLHDRINEGEAARLAKLNAEVARIADVLAKLSKHDEPMRTAIVAEPSFDYAAEQRTDSITAADIRQIVRSRRLRDRYVGSGLFEDPAWDMMLDLYAAHLERAHVSVSSLCIAAAVAPTTALRWISRLTEAGLFERRPDPFDRRRAFMSLTESGLDAMRRYVAMARTLGLPII